MHRPPSARAALAVLPASFACALTACGGGELPSEDLDPALAVPADVAVYVEAEVRPEGVKRSNVLAALRRVTGEDDPEAWLAELVGRDLSIDGEPLAGRRVGVFVAGRAGEEELGLVIPQRDHDQAVDHVRSIDGVEPDDAREYEGVEIWDTEDPSYEATVVESQAVMGTPEAIEAVIDVVQGPPADALAADGDYARAMRRLGSRDEAIAWGYVNVAPMLGLVEGVPTSARVGAALMDVEVAAQLTANAQELALEMTSPDEITGRQPGPGDAPATAYAALAAEMDENIIAGMFDDRAVRRDVAVMRRELGIDLRAEVRRWSEITVFGAPPASGGLIARTTDVARSRATLRRARDVIAATPGVASSAVSGAGPDSIAFDLGPRAAFEIAMAGDRVYIGAGKHPLRDALDRPLRRDEHYRDAAERLRDGGTQIIAFASVPASLVALVEPLGLRLGDVAPYMERFGTLSLGVDAGTGEDEADRGLVVLTLR